MTTYRVTYNEIELREVLVVADSPDEARRMVGDFEVSLINSELIETVDTVVVAVEEWEATTPSADDFEHETDTPDDYIEVETP